MAIWQLNLFFIPKQSLLNKYLHIPKQLYIDYYNWELYFNGSILEDEYTFEDAFTIHWWTDIGIYTEELFPILEIFDTEQCSVNGLKTYGNADTNNISVCFNDKTNLVEELTCSLDLRNPDMEFINKLLALAKQHDCILMDKKGRLFEPVLADLTKAVHQSIAYLYLSDPEKFLNKMAERKKKPE